jgi:hypothetical protein
MENRTIPGRRRLDSCRGHSQGVVFRVMLDRGHSHLSCSFPPNGAVSSSLADLSPRNGMHTGGNVQDGTIVSRRMDMGPGDERVKAVLNEINGRNLERSVGAWLGSQLKRRGWGRWRAAEALGVHLPKLGAWLDGRTDPTKRERERITSVFGPGLP